MTRRAWLLGAVLLVSVGCFDNGARTEHTVRGVWVRPDALRLPGTKFGPGFVVAPGSRLVGTWFPNVGPGNDGGQAMLIVDAEPQTVFKRYLDQVHRLGTATESSCELIGPGGAPVKPIPRRTVDRVEWHCTASPPGDQGGFGMYMSVGLDPFTGRGEYLPSSFLHIYWSAASRSPSASDDHIPTRAPEIEVTHRADEREPRERVAPKFTAGQLKLEPGSRAVISPDYTGFDLAFVTVLEITGDPDELWRRYTDAIGDVRPIESSESRSGWSEAAGGVGYQITMATSPDKRTWLYLSAGNDT